MWEIFGALFGTAYLTKKISSESRALKEIKKSSDSWRRSLDVWSASVTNRCLEEQIELQVYNNFDAIKVEAELICPHLSNTQIGDPAKEDVIRVLMAKHGKLTHMDSQFGIQTPLYPCGGVIPKLITKQYYLGYYAFIEWLKQELENHGVVDDMFFKPSYGDTAFYRFEDAKAIPQNGTFYWKPQDIMLYW